MKLYRIEFEKENSSKNYFLNEKLDVYQKNRGKYVFVINLSEIINDSLDKKYGRIIKSDPESVWNGCTATAFLAKTLFKKPKSEIMLFTLKDKIKSIRDILSIKKPFLGMRNSNTVFMVNDIKANPHKYSLKELAEKYDLIVQDVNNTVTRYNLQEFIVYKNNASSRKTANKISETEEILEFYLKNPTLSFRMVALHFGITTSRVGYIMKMNKEISNKIRIAKLQAKI